MAQFQYFDDTTSPAQGPKHIAKLRAEMARRGFDGLIVPRADEHQGEYVPKSAERLAWLTGFTGSAGTAVILQTKAALVVDGRYTVQAAEQVDTSVIAPVQLADFTPEAWIAENLPQGGTFAYDPWLHTSDSLKRLEQAVSRAGPFRRAAWRYASDLGRGRLCRRRTGTEPWKAAPEIGKEEGDTLGRRRQGRNCHALWEAP